MSKRTIPLSALDSIPSVNAIEGLRRNLLYAMLNGVSSDDMEQVVAKQVEKAKEGDHKAAKLLVDMIGSAAPANNMSVRQSVVFAEGQATDVRIETRKLIACMIAFSGPQTTEAIATRLYLPPTAVADAIHCDWFHREGGAWHLTNAARSQVIEGPAKTIASNSPLGEEP